MTTIAGASSHTMTTGGPSNIAHILRGYGLALAPACSVFFNKNNYPKRVQSFFFRWKFFQTETDFKFKEENLIF